MKFKFKKVDEPVCYTDEPWYDLTDGGYIEPEDLLDDHDEAVKVNEAIALVRDFLEQAFASGTLGEK